MAENSARIPGHLAHDELRGGQTELIEDAWSALIRGGSHLASAPTGIGKTAAALSAALDCARETHERRFVFFLTGRQAQHRIVVDTVKKINERNRSIHSHVSLIDLVGQQSMCIDDIRKEFPSLFSRLCADMRRNRHCKPYLNDVDGLRLKVLGEPLHVSELVEVCRTHMDGGYARPTCPWKVARESVSGADVIVCDYNHLFNERVRASSLEAMGIDLSEVIIVVDEAHNLPNRITQGMRRILTGELVLHARLEMEEHIETLAEQEADRGVEVGKGRLLRLNTVKAALERIRSDILAFFRTKSQQLHGGDSDEMRIANDELMDLLSNSIRSDISINPPTFATIASSLAEVRVEINEEDDKETASEKLSELFDILRRFGDHPALAFVFSHGQGDRPRITSHLLDPGLVSGPLFDGCAGALLMSGTLTPPVMYGELLSLPKQRGLTLSEYPSPFLSDKRPVTIAAGVTTKYTNRGVENTEKIRSHIRALAAATPGHIAVFTPSYHLLDEIVGGAIWHGRRVIVEESGWSKQRIDSLLREMEMARSAGERILLGGVFSAKLAEGVDYHRNLLDAVACVGLPLAPPSVEQTALKEYYESRFGRGNAYRWAVQQPAVNCLLQAMGRPIRKMGDRAFILLLEERLLLPNYRRLMPSSMNTITVDTPESTKRHAARFFARHPQPADTDE